MQELHAQEQHPQTKVQIDLTSKNLLNSVKSKDDVIEVHAYNQNYICQGDLIALALFNKDQIITIHMNELNFKKNPESKKEIMQILINTDKVICFYDSQSRKTTLKYFDFNNQLKNRLNNSLLVSQLLRKFPTFKRPKLTPRSFFKKHFNLIQSDLDYSLNRIIDKEQYGVHLLWRRFIQTTDVNYLHKVIQCLASQVLCLSSLTMALCIQYLASGQSEIGNEEVEIKILEKKQQLRLNTDKCCDILNRYAKIYKSDATN